MAGSLRALALVGGALRVLDGCAAVERVRGEASLLWLDFMGDIDADGVALLEAMGIHPLIIEDMTVDYAIPKLDEFPGYLYVLIHATSRGKKPEAIEMEEIDLLFNQRWLVTHHRECGVVNRVWGEAQTGTWDFEKGAGWLAHAIIDRLVDDYVPLLDSFDDVLGHIEEQIASGRGLSAALKRILSTKRALMKLRRVSSYQREILARLGRHESPHISEDLLPFFRDVYDHMGNVAMMADNYRELSTNLLDMHLSMQSNRMNEVMKTLAMFSTTLMPLTLIAGVYGMNFENMPELKLRYGYPVALCLMLVVGASAAAYFKRKHWW